jgi:uncharacterized protein
VSDRHADTIAQELGLKPTHVGAVIELLRAEATIPFIARYRKERTGEMDEQLLRAVRDRYRAQMALEERKETVLTSLEKQGVLTEELRTTVRAAETLARLEDIYLPYRPKRTTRGSKAKERGLEPLARLLFEQHVDDPSAAARRVIREQGLTGTETEASAVAGAQDIIAEWISESAPLRAELRRLFRSRALLRSRRARKGGKSGSQEATEVYRDYYDWTEAVTRVKSHWIHAVLRGEGEGVLSVTAQPAPEDAHTVIRKQLSALGAGRNPSSAQKKLVDAALTDGYARLIAPSLEKELKNELKDRADQAAAGVFAENLRDLLMAPPLGPRRVMAVDPGFRSGCKVVCLDERGGLLGNETIYPLEPHTRRDAAERTVRSLLAAHGSEYIAVGNGTGGREAESWLKSLFAGSGAAGRDSGDAGDSAEAGRGSSRNAAAGSARGAAAQATAAGSGRADAEAAHPSADTGGSSAAPGASPVVVSVSEAGASVYSASEMARAELPGQDVTVRGAVSIGRRLIDPLAELVKIPPESIGVGQYQHDVKPKLLAEKLSDTVVSCVNAVGVDLNTASAALLSHVSGLSGRQAAAIVSYRRSQGPFEGRAELKKVSGIGAKAFEQAAGFLRVHGGSEPLDATAIHPESYPVARRVAAELGVEIETLIAARPDKPQEAQPGGARGGQAQEAQAQPGGAQAADASSRLSTLDPARFTDEGTGEATVRDIIAELARPGRDPRPPFSHFAFREDVNEISDLSEGMWLPGIVTNVTDFGAFVDVGVHRDGLVHISALSEEFVSDPRTVVRVGQEVQVRVTSIDVERNRIGLSMVQ